MQTNNVIRPPKFQQLPEDIEGEVDSPATADAAPSSVGNSTSSSHTARMSDVTREEVTARLDASEARVATAIEGLRATNTEFAATMRESVGAMRVEQAELRGDLRASFSGMTTEMAQFRADIQGAIGGFRLEEEKARSAQTKWLITTIVAVGAVLAAWINVVKALNTTAPQPATPSALYAPASHPAPVAPAPSPAPADTPPRDHH